MKIPDGRTLLKVAGWAQAQWRPGPLILGYHRIAESKWDPQHLCVSKENFAQQLKVLRKLAQPVSLRHIEGGLAEGNSAADSVAITFDDGYNDSYEEAMPILERYDVAATVFVVSGAIGGCYWWNEVQTLVEYASELPKKIQLDMGEQRFHWIRRSSHTYHRRVLVKRLGDLFRSLGPSEQEAALDELRRQFRSIEAPAVAIRALSKAQVASLGASRLVDVGSHTVSHLSLGSASQQQQHDELLRSKLTLEELTGHPVHSFSYPNGITSAEAPRIAEAIGYTTGCTSRAGVVSARSNPFLLPRLWVGDWDGERFARWLRRWIR